MNVKIEKSWQEVLGPIFSSLEFETITSFVRTAYQSRRIYPPASKIFAAFDACPFTKTKVVILGQDPYHGPGQAHGLSFSVPEGVPHPPSLRNIFLEIERDLQKPVPPSGNLMRWAEQGVLLLNAVLTVESGRPNSHQKRGWESFTDQVIRVLSVKKEHLVCMLWGNYAQRKASLIDTNKHKILMTSHPSPLSVNYGFAGCGHFSEANTYLKHHNIEEIVW